MRKFKESSGNRLMIHAKVQPIYRVFIIISRLVAKIQRNLVITMKQIDETNRFLVVSCKNNASKIILKTVIIFGSIKSTVNV